MAAGLHGSARATPRVRAELQRSQEATRSLAARHGLNPKSVAKWRGRGRTADAAMAPTRPRRSVLTETEEAILVEFRCRTLLPLDDVLGLGRCSGSFRAPCNYQRRVRACIGRGSFVHVRPGAKASIGRASPWSGPFGRFVFRL